MQALLPFPAPPPTSFPGFCPTHPCRVRERETLVGSGMWLQNKSNYDRGVPCLTILCLVHAMIASVCKSKVNLLTPYNHIWNHRKFMPKQNYHSVNKLSQFNRQHQSPIKICDLEFYKSMFILKGKSLYVKLAFKVSMFASQQLVIRLNQCTEKTTPVAVLALQE